MAYKQIVGILLAAAIGTTLAAQKQTLDNQQEPAPEPYSFSYSAESTGGFSSRQESGDGTGRVSGFYTILGDDGRSRRVDYVADENGYRASISTNEVGTRSGRTADANYDVQPPSPGQLEAARVTAEEYALLERPHLQAQGIRESSAISDFRQDDSWRSRANLLAPPTNAPGQANFQPANINRQSVSDIGQQQQQQQQWRQPRSESISKSQFSRDVGALNGPEQINNRDLPQQLATVITQPIQQQTIPRPRQAIQPSILQTQMERQFMLQATQLTQQDYPRRELDAGPQEQQQPWRQFERERQQVVELSLPVNQQQQSNIINEVVDQQNEGELIPSTELPLITQPVKVSTNSQQSSSSTSVQDESLKFTERPLQSTSVTTSSIANTSVEQPSGVTSSSVTGSSNQASSVSIQQEDQVQRVTSSSQASNFLPELTTRAPMIWRPLTSTQQQQGIKQTEEGAKQSGGWITGVVMRVTSTSTSNPTTEEPEVALATTSAPGFRVTSAPEPETTVQTIALPVKQQEVAVSSASGNKWTQFGQQQQIEKKPIWQQGIKGSKVGAQQSWIQTPFRKPQIQLQQQKLQQQQQQQQQQVSQGVEYLNSTPSPTTSSIFISEDQPSTQNFGQQQVVTGGQTKWTEGGTKGGSKSSGNRFWKSRQKGRLSEAFNNQGSFGSSFGSRLNLGASTL